MIPFILIDDLVFPYKKWFEMDEKKPFLNRSISFNSKATIKRPKSIIRTVDHNKTAIISINKLYLIKMEFSKQKSTLR